MFSTVLNKITLFQSILCDKLVLSYLFTATKMNGLTLRINKSGGKKSKNTLGFAPLEFSNFPAETLVSGKDNTLLETFLNAKSADEQLEVLKKILEKYKEAYDEDTGNFLAVVFFYAEPKHPVKSFLARYITRNNAIHQPFSTALAQELTAATTRTSKPTYYKEYIEIVSKISACIENFPAGAAAVKITELTLAEYLTSCLEFCVVTLRDTKTLSPTEKNEIFNLAHLALRLLLHIVQKLNHDQYNKMTRMCVAIRVFIKHLLFDGDVPMDTKSVCGILFLAINGLERGPDAWIQILNPKGDENLKEMLSIEASQLALYSAIATAVSVDRLESETVDDKPAIIVLCNKIIAIGERSSSDSTFILGVTRSLLQITRSLNKLSNRAVGLQLVEDLQQFVWGHLEHYMDSVRHLTAQVLGLIVKYCSRLKIEGDNKALDNLFSTLSSLDRSRKSYYLSITALTAELGAASMLARSPELLGELITALSSQPVQASATTALETLLQKHVQESNTETVYSMWVQPILSHVASNTLDSGVLNILENMLAAAVRLDDGVMSYILPYIKQSGETPTKIHDLKCILMLLSVARKSGVTDKLASGQSEGEWKGIISYEVLRAAAVDSIEETRILSLSLIVESPKTTEVFTQEELNFILYFLKYNINSQSPNFRQLTLSIMKKFVKRLEDSYKVLKRQDSANGDYYPRFVEELRAFCFLGLVAGANLSRRAAALQLLAWAQRGELGGSHRIWKEMYVEKLLQHLEDSYESNKAFALEILEKCPVELLTSKKYSISLELEDILQQASSLKPSDCVSASYKLELLMKRLPERILQDSVIGSPLRVELALARRLVSSLQKDVLQCEVSVALAAAQAPLYGLLHCARRVIATLDAGAISQDESWTNLIDDLVTTCMRVNAAVASVVNNSSPEGHLPMDMGGVVVTDHGNSGGLTLEDGRQVTAQMVLLCAWRSVKEVSLLLGEISSRLTIQGEGPGGTLSPEQLVSMGEHFTRLLAETKHRGAFEQAYVGFTKLLARLWRCVSPSLHRLPREWLARLMRDIADSTRSAALCATRRSAGLPFMIQALVTTELQVQGSGKCFHECMSTLLRLARSPTEPASETESAIEVRAHSTNILRALFRNSALEESVAPYVGPGLVGALQGFEGRTWMERNSSTLLFSALLVRVFGVQRSRDAERLGVRNTMTGRIFFLRYPRLYDYMLDKLKEVSDEDSQVLRPSLYPVLLLLARLYPSSLEGTVSNLKLVSFVPLVVRCAAGSALLTRRLAARAIVPLIAPDLYMSHIEAMFDLICDVRIKRNYCHGILLQLIRLLDARPDNLIIEDSPRLGSKIRDTLWILKQAMTDVPCYLIADEYVKVINLVIWRFPSLIQQDMLEQVQTYLEEILFVNRNVLISSGRDICLANVLNLYLIILNTYDRQENICGLVYKSLLHQSYEVVLAVLNYLLILYEDFEIETKFQEHLSLISNKRVLEKLRENVTYLYALCDVFKNNKYLECTQKSLKVLTLEGNTEKYIVEVKMKDKSVEITNDLIINTLFDCIQNEHENLTHIYLQSLCKFVSDKLKDSNISGGRILEVLRVVFACSSSDNSEETRSVVAGFLETSLKHLLEFNLGAMSEEDQFEYKATLSATIVTVLEDDDAEIRQRTSNTVSALSGGGKVIPSLTAEAVREIAVSFGGSHSVAVLTSLALLDFRSEVCMTDDVNDECRVFDQNERYNIFLEETIWTRECADRIIHLQETHTNSNYILKSVIHNPIYKGTLVKLCCNNVFLFEKMVEGTIGKTKEVVNPKIKIFIDTLNEKKNE